MQEIWAFIAISMPTMVFLGLRHALDIDHITAIDNLVRLHKASKSSRLIGTAFSSGHMISVFAEMIFIIFVVGGISGTDSVSIWGGIIGAIALGSIGAINIYSMKRWGRSGSTILASKMLTKTGMLGAGGSSLVTGMVFGLGFDTSTQISAIVLSTVASATMGTEIALILAGFFALGMIPLDTLDSTLLRSVFSKTMGKKGFQYMSYALSGIALLVAFLSIYENISGLIILPGIIGPIMTVGVLVTAFGYSYVTRKKLAFNS